MKLKLLKYILPGLFLFVVALYAVTEIQYFTAKNEQDAILLEWKSGLEDNLHHFDIERSASNTNNFIKIGSLNAIGNNSYYYYRDEITSRPPGSPFEPSPIFFYRLKMVDNNGNFSFSQTISVTHIISSVRSTWGSIKAIFR
jgi:hypothetical protein